VVRAGFGGNQAVFTSIVLIIIFDYSLTRVLLK